jgi:hypothetical protein
VLCLARKVVLIKFGRKRQQYDSAGRSQPSDCGEECASVVIRNVFDHIAKSEQINLPNKSLESVLNYLHVFCDVGTAKTQIALINGLIRVPDILFTYVETDDSAPLGFLRHRLCGNSNPAANIDDIARDGDVAQEKLGRHLDTFIRIKSITKHSLLEKVVVISLDFGRSAHECLPLVFFDEELAFATIQNQPSHGKHELLT